MEFPRSLPSGNSALIGNRDPTKLVIAIESHALLTAPPSLDRKEVAQPVTV